MAKQTQKLNFVMCHEGGGEVVVSDQVMRWLNANAPDFMEDARFSFLNDVKVEYYDSHGYEAEVVFPEMLVKLPIPQWAYSYPEMDPYYAHQDSMYYFESEAREEAAKYIAILQSTRASP